VLKVFKFKKYKEGYEDGKYGESPRYLLDIGSFLRGEGRGPPENSAAHAVEMETFLNAPSSNTTPLTSSSLQIALDAGLVIGASSASAGETSSNIPSRDATPSIMSPPSAVPDMGQVSQAAPEEEVLSTSTFEASCKGKGKVSD